MLSASDELAHMIKQLAKTQSAAPHGHPETRRRTKRSERPQKMAELTLIEKYLPEYTFNEYHSIEVDCPVETVFRNAKNFDMSESKLIKTLFLIRGLPTKRMNLQGFISDAGFTNIEEKFPTEHLIGFWARTKIRPVASYDAFINNAISPRVKVVWNFRFDKINDNRTKLSTETRILCLGPVTRVTFGLYWLIVKPFSGVIRKRMLQIIKDDSEAVGKTG